MKKRFAQTAEDIDRWIKEGRGQGEGRQFLPWDTVRDVPSDGTVARVYSYKTDRISHLLSGTEEHHFLGCDFSEPVVDLRESVALLPREETQQIAAELGIRHPSYPRSSEPTVMTTDLVLTLRKRSGQTAKWARSIKRLDRLKAPLSRRDLEKLEVERRYWQRRAVPWALVTNLDMPSALMIKLTWLHALAHIDSPRLLERVSPFLEVFPRTWKRQYSHTVLMEKLGGSLRMSSGDADQIFRHAVWRHFIELDLSFPLGPDHPVAVTKVTKPTSS